MQSAARPVTPDVNPLQQTSSSTKSNLLPQPFSSKYPNMRPSRQSRHLTAWTTPSAYQQDLAFTDRILPLQLQDTHFYITGNHLTLHHLDFYLLTHNQLILQTYFTKQLEFWSTMSDTIQVLQWKLHTFTSHLQGDWLYELVTRRIMEEIADSFRQIAHVQQEETEWIFPNLLHQPEHIFIRLAEDVKHPPPFITNFTRRHSFS